MIVVQQPRSGAAVVDPFRARLLALPVRVVLDPVAPAARAMQSLVMPLLAGRAADVVAAIPVEGLFPCPFCVFGFEDGSILHSVGAHSILLRLPRICD